MKKKIIILLLAFVIIACNHEITDYREYEITIEGRLEYYVDNIFWLGGESDPSGFALSNYLWIYGAPDFNYYRVYVTDKVDSTYLNNQVKISGELETIFAGGIETRLRKFPLIRARKIQFK